MTQQRSDFIKHNQVRFFREKKGLSQFALAKEIGVARQTINLIENNKYNPSLDLCLKLAKQLDTDLNNLFWEVTNNEKERSTEN